MSKIRKELDLIENKHGLGIALLIAIILLVIVVAFQGLVVWFVYNYLLLYLIPSLPYLSFIKSCIAGVILSTLGSFLSK